MRLLITNNGPHSAEKWAVATAEDVFNIDGLQPQDDRLIAAKKLQIDIASALMVHHDKVIHTERDNLASDAKHILTEHDVSPYLDQVVEDIQKVATGTPWEGHFGNPEVHDAIRTVAAHYFTTVQQSERLWHADRNPECQYAQSYRAMASQ